MTSGEMERSEQRPSLIPGGAAGLQDAEPSGAARWERGGWKPEVLAHGEKQLGENVVPNPPRLTPQCQGPDPEDQTADETGVV